jgi:hypothetical protein
MTRRILFLACASMLSLLPATAGAQIPMPTGIPNPLSGTAGQPVKAKADPVARAQARVDAIKAQLAALREIASWASTNRTELWKLYSDSLANLIQARAAIRKGAAPYLEPKGFEIEPVVVTSSSTYPGAASTYAVQTVPPDSFYLHTRVQFPDAWVAVKKRMTVTYNIYPEVYLPMATTYQNASNAIFQAYSYSLTADSKIDTFHSAVSGLALPPGRYYVSCVVSTYDYPREYMVSLGLFRVDGKLPATVKLYPPHHVAWYRTYNPQIKLDDAKATVKGKNISLSGAFTRVGFQKGKMKPATIEAVAEQGATRRVVLRLNQPINTEKSKFGGKPFLIADHGLAPGTYSLKVTVYTEHPSSDSKYAYLTGSKAEKTLSITVP